MIHKAGCLAGFAALAALAAAPARADVVAIEGAVVHARPGEVVKDATVVVRDGTIAAVGEGAEVPEGARRIDAGGKVVTAGFVEASTRLGLVEVIAVEATNEGVFNGEESDDVVHAAYRVTDGYNPRSMAIPIARTGGVTSVVATPAGALVSGTSAWMTLAQGTAETNTVLPAAAMVATLGEGSLDAASGSRGMAVERLRELLDDARTYASRRGAYERGRSREMAAERLDLEALVPVVRGELPLVVRADRASDVRAALAVAEEFGLDLVIEGGTEAWLAADALAEAGVPVILDPLDNLPSSFDRIHVRDDLPAVLAEAGVEVAISSRGNFSAARTLGQRAGNAIARGMSREAALAAVTTVPAAIFGVQDRGRVAPGQRADLVVWSGDPFELSSTAERVLIGGEEQPLDTHQSELLDRYR